MRDQSVHDSFQALTKRGAAEVDEQADRQSHQAQVSEQLLAMHRRKSFESFQFDNDKFFYQEINSKPVPESPAFVLK